ncbi:MAG: SIMPL domain-containing protein [Rhodospirillales bacterium]|nr:SIMPL domain-containing protein [Rhodospirillales bacterium]
MNRIIAAALLAPALLATTPVFAQDEAPRLALQQTAERDVPQDRLTASLRVEATAATPAAVQADVNRRMEAAVARARAVAGVRVETTGYSTWEERPANQPRRWRGQAGLALTGKDAAAVLALAGALQEQGLAMAGLRFDLTPEAQRAIEDELTAEAIARVRARADRAAQALGLRVTGIAEIRVGEAGVGSPPPRPVAMRAMAAGAEAAPPVAEAGLATVRVGIDATFRLGPK